MEETHMQTSLHLRHSLFTLLLAAASLSPLAAHSQERLTIDAHAATTPFPHFWEQTFGSGRAILSLRESYRKDLRTVKQATGFQSIRFHGIFMDEVGLYDPDRRTINFAQTAGKTGNTVDDSAYNFSYVDQIYDGLLDEPRQALRRAELHAQEARLRPRRAARLLVQAQRLATARLRQPGTP